MPKRVLKLTIDLDDSEVAMNPYLVEIACKDYLGMHPDIEGVSLTGCNAAVNEKVVKAVATMSSVTGIVASQCMLRLPTICTVLEEGAQLRHLDLSSNNLGPKALQVSGYR